MCQPHHFLSKFLTCRSFPAYPSYILYSYKKRVYYGLNGWAPPGGWGDFYHNSFFCPSPRHSSYPLTHHNSLFAFHVSVKGKEKVMDPALGQVAYVEPTQKSMKRHNLIKTSKVKYRYDIVSLDSHRLCLVNVTSSSYLDLLYSVNSILTVLHF